MYIIFLSNIFMFVYINSLINKGVRFQNVNIVEKMVRYRFYFYMPFIWLYYCLKSTNSDHRLIWKLLIGEQQMHMKWYYTSDEVKKRFKNL